jgi:hypothetical protein
MDSKSMPRGAFVGVPAFALKMASALNGTLTPVYEDWGFAGFAGFAEFPVPAKSMALDGLDGVAEAPE